MSLLGTLFTPTNLSTPDDFLTAFGLADQPFSDPFPSDFLQAMHKIFELYPDDPALGSPFGTGNNTFGLNSEYKRMSAIFGDISFQNLRRTWIQTASAAGVSTFGYVFADQNAVTDPSKGGVSTSFFPADVQSRLIVIDVQSLTGAR